MRRAVMRMVNGKLAASLVAWRENAFEMKDGKRKMAGFLNRMINRKVSAAFETWQANASEGKDAEAAAEEESDEDDASQAGSIIWELEGGNCRCASY